MAPMTTESTAHAADVEAIRQVVATVERAQRARDVEGFLALFHPDAFWTTGHGKVLLGFDAIAEFTREVLPNADGVEGAGYEVTHVQFLRPDVAAVKVRQVYRGADGAVEGPEGSPLYVMTKQGDGGRWLLTACQNTQVHG
ncbi:SgcJ/EcaC family oxidoreductase [Streptomyces sp. NPDC090022]|uniref:SgcJ/EcaC family oxidoreductase n=1 Tax=Streptomyces sp. NPDC090022 TaxID=3365920 RepID=UPI00382BD89B